MTSLINDIMDYKFVPRDYFFNIDYMNIFSLLIAIFIFIQTYFLISKKEFMKLFYVIIIFVVIIICINKKMLTNKYLTNKYIHPKNIEKSLNTGDFVLYRNYEFDFLGYPLMVILYCIYFNIFFTHVGMIYKNQNGNTFIIEMNLDPYYCNIAKKKVGKGLQCLDFCDKMKNNSNFHRVHIIKNNLYKFIDIKKLNSSINKYKNYKFGQDGINCLHLLIKFLEENNLFTGKGLLTKFDDLIDPKNYKVPVIFDEPILVKEYIP